MDKESAKKDKKEIEKETVDTRFHINDLVSISISSVIHPGIAVKVEVRETIEWVTIKWNDQGKKNSEYNAVFLDLISPAKEVKKK